jgi:hypothetical protein
LCEKGGRRERTWLFERNVINNEFPIKINGEQKNPSEWEE